jgi:predicted porin
VVGAALFGAVDAQAQQQFQTPGQAVGEQIQARPLMPAQIGRPSNAPHALQVRLGGYFVFEANYQTDDLDRASGLRPQGVGGIGRVARQRTDFKNEVELTVDISGKAANGMSYGGIVEIQNDGTGGTIFDVDEAYTFVSSPTLGTLRFGEEDSAASLLQVRAPAILGMGLDGDWDDGLLSSSAFTGGGPSLLTGINDGNDSTKIVYLSPQFFGFDFGVSFSPNRNEGDRIIGGRAVDSISVTAGSALAPTPVQRDGTGLTNEISAAIRYRGSFQNVGVAAGFGAQFADSPGVNTNGTPITNQAKNVSTYTVGAQVSAYGFTFGGEYTWGNYLGNPATGALPQGRDMSSHYGFGLTYVMGAWSFGGFYGVASQSNGPGVSSREQTIWGIGTAYTIAPGLEVFASYNQLRDNNVNISLPAVTISGTTYPAGTLQNRDAEVLMVGTRLAF